MSTVVDELRKAKAAQLEECKHKAAQFDVLIEQAEKMLSGLTITPQNPLEGLRSLDGLPVREAIREYLAWAESKGREEVTMGELEEALAKYRVLTSQRTELKLSSNPWKTIANTVTSGPNQEFFEVDKRGLHIQRNDTIRLVHKDKRRKA